MKITRFGHAAVLIECAEERILIDPGSFSQPEVFDITDLAAIIVTHEHADHLDRDRAVGLLERNPRALTLAPPALAEDLGGRWEDWTDGEGRHVGSVTLRAVGTRHAEILPELPRVQNTGVLIHADGEPTFFHPGDTYENVPEGVDVLAVPLSAPWAKVSETVGFVQAVAPGAMFPIHDCTIADLAYDIYWGQAMNHGGVADTRRLGQRDSAIYQL